MADPVLVYGVVTGVVKFVAATHFFITINHKGQDTDVYAQTSQANKEPRAGDNAKLEGVYEGQGGLFVHTWRGGVRILGILSIALNIIFLLTELALLSSIIIV